METKVVKKFFGLPDFIDEQEFLQKHHKEGWKFKTFKAPKTYTFEKCEPEEYIYQLDFNEAAKDEESYLQIFEDCGWEYVMKYQTWYYFRKEKSIANENDNNIFSDAESKIDMCNKVYRRQGIVLLPLICGVMYWYVFLLTNNIKNIPIAITISASLFLIIMIYSLGYIIGNFNKLNKMIKKIKNPLNYQDK